MQKVEPITIINVDDVPHAVSDMSDDVKMLVEYYNEWRQDEIKLKSDLMKVQAAMRDLSREIITTIRREKELAKQQEEAVKVAQEAANEAPTTPTDETSTDADD